MHTKVSREGRMGRAQGGRPIGAGVAVGVAVGIGPPPTGVGIVALKRILPVVPPAPWHCCSKFAAKRTTLLVAASITSSRIWNRLVASLQLAPLLMPNTGRFGNCP